MNRTILTTLLATLLIGICLHPLPAADTGPQRDIYLEAAFLNGLDPDIVRAVAEIESSHRPYAISHAGARGLMQIMPATGAWFCDLRGQALFVPRNNVHCGTAYLRYLLDKFNGSLPLALAGYYTGPGTVKRNGYRIPKRAYSYIRKFRAAYYRLKQRTPEQKLEETMSLLEEARRYTPLLRLSGGGFLI